MGEGARYWRLIEVGVEYDETIKSPCDGRGLGGVKLLFFFPHFKNHTNIKTWYKIPKVVL